MVGAPLMSLPAQQTMAVERRTTETESVLDRKVTLRLDHVSLREAVATAATTAGVRIQYRDELLDRMGTSITLSVTSIPLGDALGRLLTGTRLHAVVAGKNIVSIEPMSVAGTGTIAGTVTNAQTQQPVHSVTVVLDDSVKVERTGETGQYRFLNVNIGVHTITVRAIGLARQTKRVMVDEDKVSTVNFTLESSVNTLDRVVVTATGPQRYRELGHVVAVVNADSLVRSAPITSMAELLTARVPGLQVVTSGTVGGEVALRLRGQTTAYLDPQPIVIVDGVRYKNTNTIPDGYGNLVEDRRAFGAEPRSPLNDLNVNDIETVEVVKGPSATTLYGPDAANGVIVVTTKRGKAGKPEWRVYAHPNLHSEVPDQRIQALTYYQAWGHDPSTGETVPYNCTLEGQYHYHACILDSLTIAPRQVTDNNVSVVSPRIDSKDN